jgi:hypothetical protein
MANQPYARVAWAMLRLLHLIRDISTTLPASLGGEKLGWSLDLIPMATVLCPVCLNVVCLVGELFLCLLVVNHDAIMYAGRITWVGTFFVCRCLNADSEPVWSETS